MDFSGILGSLISGVSSIFGGSQKDKAAKEVAAQNIAAQQAFAQQGITWKAQDAVNAENATGINKLALLGVPTSSFSNITGDSGLGEGIGKAGQDIGRAVAAATSRPSRQQQLEEQLLEAKIANVNADTVRMSAAASAIATKLGQPGTPPGIPLPRADMRRVGPAFFAKPLMQDYVGPHGGVVTLPSADASQAMQNWGSMPAQVAVAAGLTGENAANAVADVVPSKAVFGPSWLGVDNTQYAPF